MANQQVKEKERKKLLELYQEKELSPKKLLTDVERKKLLNLYQDEREKLLSLYQEDELLAQEEKRKEELKEVHWADIPIEQRGLLAPSPEKVPYTPSRRPLLEIPTGKPSDISTKGIITDALKTQLQRSLGIPTEKLAPIKPLEAYKKSLSLGKRLIGSPLKLLLEKPTGPSKIPHTMKNIVKSEIKFWEDTCNLINMFIPKSREDIESISRYLDKKVTKALSKYPLIGKKGRNQAQVYYQKNYGAEEELSEQDKITEDKIISVAKSMPKEMAVGFVSNLKRMGTEPIELMKEKGVTQLAIDAAILSQLSNLGLRLIKAGKLAYRASPEMMIKDILKKAKKPPEVKGEIPVEELKKALKPPRGVAKEVYAKPIKELDLFQQIRAHGGIRKTAAIDSSDWKRIPLYLKRGKGKSGLGADEIATEIGYKDTATKFAVDQMIDDIIAKRRRPSALGYEVPEKMLIEAEEAEIKAMMESKEYWADELMQKHLEEVTPFIKKRMEKGSIEIYRRRKGIAPAELKSPIPEVEIALTAQRKPGTIWQSLKASARRIYNGIGETFSYEFSVRKHPKFKNQLRKFKDTPRDSATFATNHTVGIVGDLSKAEYENFRRLVVLEDWVETAGLGAEIPHSIKIQDAVAELNRQRTFATPKVTRALERNRELWQSVGEELARRGKIDPRLLREKYFPHEVLDYSFGIGDYLPWMPRRLKIQYRGYTKPRLGSARDINTDFIDVNSKHLARIYLDNKVDDFAVSIAKEYDLMPLVRKGKLKLDPPFAKGDVIQPRGIYRIEGKDGLYMGYQIQPGNTLYRGLTANEKLAEQAIAEGWSGSEVVASMKQAGILGRPHKVYLLPEDIAKRLYKFKEPIRGAKVIVPQLRSFVRFWKGFTLGFAGASFQLNNFIGDTINIYREDIGALLKYPQASKALVQALRGKTGETYKELLALADQQRVLYGAGYIREVRGGRSVFADPRISHLTGLKGKVTRASSIYYQLNELRENVPRMALFMKKIDDIKAGKLVYSKTVNIKGLGKLEAAGKIAREVPIDYGALTPFAERNLRGLLFPFYTFYAGNFINWSKYIARHPLEATAKVGVPYAGMFLWNNLKFPEIESSLPPWIRWMPHIVTGWKDKDGKAIVITIQTPVELAAKFVGLDRLADKITRIRAGQMSVKEAAEEQIKDTFLGAPRMGRDLINPMAKVIQGLLQNKDPFTKRTIVPSNLKGTDEGIRRQMAYAIGQLFTPIGQYMRVRREFEEEGEIARTLKKPLEPGYVRRVDLEKAEYGRMMEKVGKVAQAEREVLSKIEKKYIDAVSKGEVINVTNYVEEAMKKYETIKPIVSAEMIINRLNSPRVRIEIARRQLAKAKTDEDKDRLKALIKRLQRMQRVQSLSRQKKRLK